MGTSFAKTSLVLKNVRIPLVAHSFDKSIFADDDTSIVQLDELFTSLWLLTRVHCQLRLHPFQANSCEPDEEL